MTRPTGIEIGIQKDIPTTGEHHIISSSKNHKPSTQTSKQPNNMEYIKGALLFITRQMEWLICGLCYTIMVPTTTVWRRLYMIMMCWSCYSCSFQSLYKNILGTLTVTAKQQDNNIIQEHRNSPPESMCDNSNNKYRR